MTDVVVAGVGMVPFAKPRESGPHTELAEGAARAALTDAGLEYGAVGQIYAGYVYGDSTAGQAALYGLGLTGVPVVNVNNNCSTGSSALFLARQAVASGVVDCALALGFEQMTPGALTSTFTDRVSPLSRHDEAQRDINGPDDSTPQAARFFGGAGQAYVDEYGTDPAVFAHISVKARRHAANNPYAVFRDPITLDDVLGSPVVYGPLTRLQCCPPTCGAAAAIVCTPEFARSHGIDSGVRIKAQSLVTDLPGTFDAGDMRKIAGYDMTVRAAHEVYEASGVGPEDIRVVELHDCFTTNEFLTYEALGLTPEGTAEKFVLDSENTYGGRVVTNPSGGLLSKGHPLGATGLAQCAELVWQLRGRAGARQVDGVSVALQHNLGLGGACVVTMYEKAGA
ncbi:lipid-transfer protein [Streptomyces sp. NPDC057681]|uniref:lipid-transfer protein n=1 Tax=Streptomyces sp. NPDC057681 TaxID=3346209 RepID=UPI0036B0753B